MGGPASAASPASPVRIARRGPVAVLAIAAFALLAATVGCSSTNVAGNRFRTITTSVDAPLATFQRQLASSGGAATFATLRPAATSCAHAIERVNVKLLAAQWPGGAQQDVKNLAVTGGELVLDLDMAGAPPAGLTVTKWAGRVHADETKMLTSSNKVRADLGLPTSAS